MRIFNSVEQDKIKAFLEVMKSHKQEIDSAKELYDDAIECLSIDLAIPIADVKKIVKVALERDKILKEQQKSELYEEIKVNLGL